MEGERNDKVRMSQDSGMSSVGSVSPADDVAPTTSEMNMKCDSNDIGRDSNPCQNVKDQFIIQVNNVMISEEEELLELSDQFPSSDIKYHHQDSITKSHGVEEIFIVGNRNSRDTDSAISSSGTIDLDIFPVAELPPLIGESLNNEAEKIIDSPDSNINICAKTVQPSFTIFYLGSLQLDRRHTATMLPWAMAEVRRRHEVTPVNIIILPESLHAITTNGDGKLLFEHKLQGLTRFARTHQDNTIFAYSTRSGPDSPFTCHVFQAMDSDQVPKLFQAIRHATKEVMKRDHSGNEGKSVDDVCDLVKMGQQFFEVLYSGRVQVNSKKSSPSFIDEMVDKFKTEVTAVGRQRHSSSSSVSSLPASLDNVQIKENDLERSSTTSSASGDLDVGTGNDSSSAENLLVDVSTSQKQPDVPRVKIRHASASSLTSPAKISPDTTKVRHNSTHEKPSKDSENLMKDSLLGHGAFTGLSDVGRIMLFKIGCEEVCLISTDQKTVILDRNFKDISFCAQGVRHADHFGFICRNHQNNSFICYVFKCASDAVVDEVMRGLQQAFQAAYNKSARNHHVICELCPMHQLHKLCQEIDGMAASKVHDIITKRVDQLSERDKHEIMARVKNESPMSVGDSNEITMKALRILCEARQVEHKHISDSNRQQQARKGNLCLMDPSKLQHSTSCPSGAALLPPGPISASRLDKVRRSLTNSFEHLLKAGRKNSRDELIDQQQTAPSNGHSRQRSYSDINSYNLTDSSANTTPDASPCPSPIKKEFGDKFALKRREEFAHRPRSHTMDTIDKKDPAPAYSSHESPASRKISAPGSVNPPRTSDRLSHSIRPSSIKHSSRGGAGDYTSPNCSPRHPAASRLSDTPSRRRLGSWRQAIFISVVTPAGRSRRQSVGHDDVSYASSDADSSPRTPSDRPILVKTRLTQAEIRGLWRKAILETLLLIRMERENKNLQARQDEMETRRIKLDYEEITPCLIKVTKIWEDLIKAPNRSHTRVSANVLNDAVRAGVPRNRRGEIWSVLVEQHRLSHVAVQTASAFNDAPYNDLLRQLTNHQHAILIDLGRTFPMHPYFSTQLGAGQLALFNLLKCYSLLDSEVGYCQGLSFVAGILLMHMVEEDAFSTLKYIMFNLGLRSQYRPDMTALQIQLYQLSRLLHDHYKDLYEHFELHEINPTLYAAPWFLTLFASQFPLGFVARVFDLLLLQGIEVIFKVALTLLGYHKELIMQCDSFESVVEFLKTTLPAMGIIQMERVINQVFVMDINQKLNAYEVEYHVLQEEMLNSPGGRETDTILRLEAANASLRQYNLDLVEQLHTANSNQRSLEGTIQSMQNNENKLKSHIQTLELERAALLNTVQKLRELIPDDAISGANVSIPAVTPATTNVGSPLHTNAAAANRERKKPVTLSLGPSSSQNRRTATQH